MCFRRAVNLLAIVLIFAATWRLLFSGPSAEQIDAAPSPEPQDSQAPTLRIYDLRDIWPRAVQEVQIRDSANKSARHMPTSNFGMGAVEIFGSSGVPGPPPTPQDIANAHVEALIRDYVTRDDWLSNGGFFASLQSSGPFVTIWHTPEGHRQVEQLLTAFRRADQMRWQEQPARGQK